MPSSFLTTSRQRLPVVPLRDMVVFPYMMAPFIVGREGSVRALEQTLATGDLVSLAANYGGGGVPGYRSGSNHAGTPAADDRRVMPGI